MKHIHFPGSFLWEPHCGFDCRWSPSRHADSQALVIMVAAFGLNPCFPYRRLVREEAQASTHCLGTGLPRPFLLPQGYFCHMWAKKKAFWFNSGGEILPHSFIVTDEKAVMQIVVPSCCASQHFGMLHSYLGSFLIINHFKCFESWISVDFNWWVIMDIKHWAQVSMWGCWRWSRPVTSGCGWLQRMTAETANVRNSQMCIHMRQAHNVGSHFCIAIHYSNWFLASVLG